MNVDSSCLSLFCPGHYMFAHDYFKIRENAWASMYFFGERSMTTGKIARSDDFQRQKTIPEDGTALFSLPFFTLAQDDAGALVCRSAMPSFSLHVLRGWGSTSKGSCLKQAPSQ